MKISDLKVNGFGVWSGLELADLSSETQRFLRPQRSRQDDPHAVRALGALRFFARAAHATCRRCAAAVRAARSWPKPVKRSSRSAGTPAI